MTNKQLAELREDCAYMIQSFSREQMLECVAEIERLRKGINELASTLRWLYDFQNGPPLPKYEEDWLRTMELAKSLLKQWEEPLGNTE